MTTAQADTIMSSVNAYLQKQEQPYDDLKKINFYLIIAFAIILADRLTKSWALKLQVKK